MCFVGTADIRQAELGEQAVRQHDHVVRAGQDMRRPPGAFDDASLRPVAEQDPVADAIGPAKRERDAREYVTERILQGKTENDGDHARRGDQRADRHAENEGKDRQSSAEIDDAHDEVLEKAGLPGLSLEDQIDAHEANDRPCQVHPPEQLRGYDQKRAALLRSLAFEAVRRDVVADQNGGHDKEESDLDDEARVRATARNQMPDDDAGEADKIQLYEWRRNERVKRHLIHHARLR
jgi:hypothetical protein